MTYAFVVGHTLFTLSCEFYKYLYVNVLYTIILAFFLTLCTFVREYYFGL